MLEPDYVARAMQDARRFQGCWDTGTSGVLAAHTARLVKDREELMSTIEKLQRENQALRAAVEGRLAATPSASDEPVMVAGGSPDHLEAAWSRYKASQAQVQRAARTPARAVYGPPSGPKIIGFCGRAGAGKSAAAAMVPGAVVMGFADPLYAAAALLLGLPEPILRSRAVKDSHLEWLGTSPREVLQTLGTEWGRSLISPTIWIDLARRRIDQWRQAGALVIALSDVRFDNEAQMIREAGGEVWRVFRTEPSAVPACHSSEHGVSDELVTDAICNDGTLDDLRAAVESRFARLVA